MQRVEGVECRMVVLATGWVNVLEVEDGAPWMLCKGSLCVVRESVEKDEVSMRRRRSLAPEGWGLRRETLQGTRLCYDF